MSKFRVSVPGNPSDPPYTVTGKNVIKVANWILEGVQQAHHSAPPLLHTFSAWRHFTGPVAVPQYVETDHNRMPVFDFDLRPVSWSVDEFVRQALAAIREKGWRSGSEMPRATNVHIGSHRQLALDGR